MAASLPRALSSSRPASEPRGLRRGRCRRPIALLRRRSGGDRPRSAAAPPPAGGPGGPGAGGQRCGTAAATPASVPAPPARGRASPGLGVSPRSTPRGPSGDKAGERVPLNRSSLRWPPANSGRGFPRGLQATRVETTYFCLSVPNDGAGGSVSCFP